MLTYPIEVIIVQYIHASNNYIVYLKLTLYVNNISIKLEKYTHKHETNTIPNDNYQFSVFTLGCFYTFCND